jgi:exopolysaccharide production protein ExoZ
MTVQALRAVAALQVVAYHSFSAWTERVFHQPADDFWPNGSGGVDIFFVVSGLVMVMSADRLAGRPGAWRIFLRHRLVRIVPLYWIMTTAKVAIVLVLPALALRTRLDPAYVTGSYLFLPVYDSNGDFFPVLPDGWTLSYEMLFYGLVTIALSAHVPILAVAAPALGAFALFGIAGGSDGFVNAIVIEFLFGVVIGIAIRRPRYSPPLAAAALLLLGFAIILTGPVISGALRPITWGIPAACIVASAVALEQRATSRIPRWLLDLGDASYSIYLMHGFVIPVVFAVIMRVVPAFFWLPAAVVFSLLASAAVGRLGFCWIERPLLSWLRQRTKAPSLVAGG